MEQEWKFRTMTRVEVISPSGEHYTQEQEPPFYPVREEAALDIIRRCHLKISPATIENCAIKSTRKPGSV